LAFYSQTQLEFIYVLDRTRCREAGHAHEPPWRMCLWQWHWGWCRSAYRNTAYVLCSGT